MLSPTIHSIQPPAHIFTTEKEGTNVIVSGLDQSMEEQLNEVRDLFKASLQPDKLYAYSQELQHELYEKAQHSDISMLPSWVHTLPTGQETGTFLALDVGGSNFRLAIIELTGRHGSEDGMRIRRTKSYNIDARIRALKGPAFFEWIADRIQEMLDLDSHNADGGSEPLRMGLAWSFPIEQTSTRSGSLLTMGKGFSATHGVEGQDLCELIMAPCRERRVNVELQSVVNDSSATLLSQAYRDPATRISLILGTGTNAAAFLPVSVLAKEKFGERASSWHAAAKRVLVNTELSMHGKDVFPISRWDKMLTDAHPLPDFQPLEYKVSGRYITELVRLILLEAVKEGRLFDGMVPQDLQEPYSMETGILAAFEWYVTCSRDHDFYLQSTNTSYSDTTPSLSHASNVFQKAHPIDRHLSTSELRLVQHIIRLVSNRATAYLATAVHALWSLCLEAEGVSPSKSGNVTIACNGSILEKYPEFRSRCQAYLDQLVALSGAGECRVALQMAPESSAYGAAVAIACLKE